MKKVLLLLVSITIIIGITIKLPPSITGLFVKVTSTAIEIARSILKEVLTKIIELL
jgi:hypothetical protein